MSDRHMYEPDPIGTRICPDDVCRASNQWLAGQRPPDRCRLCERALTCASPTCGAVLCEGDEELCAECETPRVTVLDAVETEYGLTLVEVRR